MRLLSLLLLSAFSLAALAEQPVPPKLEPLPPPPAFNVEDAPDEPEVTITRETEQTVEEFRANGKLYMIKVTPKHGVPYYLVDESGDGSFARKEGPVPNLIVPRWIIHKF
ncbi:MAG: hypothetical protein A2Z95_01705 [Gallionellales bacterium GWA2_60_18]|nr:MAG: hypothetical protein A2Z95_01705 [Gallionellales bacterium GWA2_60_18]